MNEQIANENTQAISPFAWILGDGNQVIEAAERLDAQTAATGFVHRIADDE